jgi:anti-sigma regulatory factor (Ser/Thr protein kinase)
MGTDAEMGGTIRTDDEPAHATAEESTARAVLEALQRALLPRVLPVAPGLTIEARYIPGGDGLHLGGDWYDAFSLPNGRVVLAIGDVVGRGPLATAAMSRLRAMLEVYALEGSSPRAVLERLNQSAEIAGHDDVAAVTVLTIDPASGRVEIATAGHPPVAIRDADGTVTFASGPSGPPIGATARARFAQHDVVLGAGATLVCYTDGLVARRGEGLDAGLARLAELLTDGPDDLVALADHLLGTPDRHADDVALVVVRADREVKPLTLRLPARLRSLRPTRHALAYWLQRAGADAETASSVVLAVNEAVANAVEHAYQPGAGEVNVEARLDGATIEVRVCDGGAWRPRRDAGGGLGLHLMERLVDDIEVDTTGRGTTVVLRVGSGHPGGSRR